MTLPKNLIALTPKHVSLMQATVSEACSSNISCTWRIVLRKHRCNSIEKRDNSLSIQFIGSPCGGKKGNNVITEWGT
jgi:hypothetical protein